MNGNCRLQSSKDTDLCEVPYTSPSFQELPPHVLWKNFWKGPGNKTEESQISFRPRICPNSRIPEDPNGELLDRYNWRQLREETLLVVILATTKRVGESQAISCSTSFQNGKCHSSYLPEFVAKDWDIKKTRSSDPSFLKSLQAGVEDTKDEVSLLCPVRTPYIYSCKVQDVNSST